MENKAIGKILNNKRIVEEFDKYINSKEIGYQLERMLKSTTQYYMVDMVRSVWNRMKEGKY